MCTNQASGDANVFEVLERFDPFPPFPINVRRKGIVPRLELLLSDEQLAEQHLGYDYEGSKKAQGVIDVGEDTSEEHHSNRPLILGLTIHIVREDVLAEVQQAEHLNYWK